MSDLIRRLATRAIGFTPVTPSAPRLPGTFEDGLAQDEVAAGVPDRQADAHAHANPPVVHVDAPGGDGSQSARARRPAPSRRRPEPEPTTSAPPVEVEQRVPIPGAPLPAAETKAAGTSDAGAPAATAASPRGADVTRTVRTEAHRPTERGRRDGPAAVPSVVAARPRVETTAPDTDAGDPPEPVVRVHIGRLDVHAAPHPPATDRRRSPVPTPAVSLSDYLRGRREAR